MLLGDVVPCPVDRAPKYGPNALNGIGMYIPSNAFTSAVLNRIVPVRTVNSSPQFPAAVVTLALSAASRDLAIAFAQRAYNVTIPSLLFQVGFCRHLVGEHLEKLEGADRVVVLHG